MHVYCRSAHSGATDVVLYVVYAYLLLFFPCIQIWSEVVAVSRVGPYGQCNWRPKSSSLVDVRFKLCKTMSLGQQDLKTPW